MAAGDKVTMWYCSANRDEAKFAHPWMFDIARDPNPHIGFGGGGAHFCLGANLARREIAVAFDELHRRIPGHRSHRGTGAPALVFHPRHQTPAGGLDAARLTQARRQREAAARFADSVSHASRSAMRRSWNRMLECAAVSRSSRARLSVVS